MATKSKKSARGVGVVQSTFPEGENVGGRFDKEVEVIPIFARKSGKIVRYLVRFASSGEGTVVGKAT